MIVPLAEGTLDAVRYCNLIIRLAREDVEFHAALKFYSGLCGFLVSGSSWTEVQCLTGLCPLWVKSGHSARFDRCPLYPRKWSASSASALSQKRTFASARTVCLLWAITGLMHYSKHQAGPFPRSVSCTCLSSALLTNSTESIAAPSWVRNCSIASFIGGGRSPHQLIT